MVLGQSDLPGTYHEYAKVAGLEESLKQYKGKSDTVLFEVTLIRREVERKMGQMLLEIPRKPGARTDLTSSGDPMRLYGDILEDLGLKPDRAHSWQLAARYPDERFRELVELYRVTRHPITLEELVYLARNICNWNRCNWRRESRLRKRSNAGARRRFCPRLMLLLRAVYR